MNNSSILIKVRKLATLIKYTYKNRKLLNEGIKKYKDEGVLPVNYNVKLIPLDNVTRWNSTYKMIKTTLELKRPLIYISKNTLNPDFINNILNEFEWEVLTELKTIFEIFVKPSVKL